MVSKIALLAVAAIAAIAAGGVWLLTHRPAPPLPAAGVPLALAEDRARRITDLRYDLSLSVPPSRTDPIQGRLIASFTLADATQPLAFDFAQPVDHLVRTLANG